MAVTDPGEWHLIVAFPAVIRNHTTRGGNCHD